MQTHTVAGCATPVVVLEGWVGVQWDIACALGGPFCRHFADCHQDVDTTGVRHDRWLLGRRHASPRQRVHTPLSPSLCFVDPTVALMLTLFQIIDVYNSRCIHVAGLDYTVLFRVCLKVGYNRNVMHWCSITDPVVYLSHIYDCLVTHLYSPF